MRRWLRTPVGLALVVSLAGCGMFERGVETTPPPPGGAGKEESDAPFPEHQPILPSGGVIGDAAEPTFTTSRTTPQVTVAPVVARDVEPEGTPVRTSWREPLAEVARQLSEYRTREPETLDSFSRLKLLQLKREALLLLLLSGRFDSEECRSILEVFRTHELTNLELEGLRFVLYQRTGETKKRNEILTVLESETRLQPRFQLDEVSFCTKVVGFRAVVKAQKTAFAAGETVTLYGEFCGAASRSTPGGQQEQQIQVYLSVLDEGGKIVDTVEFVGRAEGTRSLTSGERDDARSYFSGEYRLPNSLQAGRYQLRLAATDLVSHAEAHQVVPFEVTR